MDANSTSAILFPGQGVGDASSRELVGELRPDLLDLAGRLVGEDPFERMAEGTAYAQPAVYCVSIAGYELLGRPAADYFAGHSLGEIGALAAAGAIDDADGLRIVVARGRVMEEAARAGAPGGMLAVGSDCDRAEELAEEHGLTLANENSPQQFVLSGPLARIEDAEAAAKGSGMRAKKLAVAGAFHTEAMSPGVEAFRAELDEIDFKAPARSRRLLDHGGILRRRRARRARRLARQPDPLDGGSRQAQRAWREAISRRRTGEGPRRTGPADARGRRDRDHCRQGVGSCLTSRQDNSGRSTPRSSIPKGWSHAPRA